MISVDALVFDLDGTLVDSRRDIANSVHVMQKKYGRPLSSEAEVAGFIGDGATKLVERAIGSQDSQEVQVALSAFLAHYSEHALDTTYAYPGVLETLEHFRQKKMAVLTNKPGEVSQRILDGLGLGKFFPVVIGGDAGIRKKPDPEGVNLALKQLGVPSGKQVLMVGDSAQDILAGRAARALTCGLFSNIGDQALLKEAKPDYTISSLQELMRIIA